MKNYLIPLFATLIFSLPAYAEKASPESIKDMMNKTGSGDMGIQAMNQILPALKQMIPDAPEKFWQDFMAKFNPDDLINMTIPIYQKHLTQEDLDGINAFYDTPAGKNLIQAQPHIMKESMQVGQAWGQKVAQEVISQYEALK